MTIQEAMATRAEKRKAESRKAKQTAMATARELKPEPEKKPFDEAAAKAEFAALDRLALTVWMSGGMKAPSGHVGGGMMRNLDWLKSLSASRERISQNGSDEFNFPRFSGLPRADNGRAWRAGNRRRQAG